MMPVISKEKFPKVFFEKRGTRCRNKRRSVANDGPETQLTYASAAAADMPIDSRFKKVSHRK